MGGGLISIYFKMFGSTRVVVLESIKFSDEKKKSANEKKNKMFSIVCLSHHKNICIICRQAKIKARVYHCCHQVKCKSLPLSCVNCIINVWIFLKTELDNDYHYNTNKNKRKRQRKKNACSHSNDCRKTYRHKVWMYLWICHFVVFYLLISLYAQFVQMFSTICVFQLCVQMALAKTSLVDSICVN